MMVGTDPKESMGWGSSAQQGCSMSSNPQQTLLRGWGITSKWVMLTSVVPRVPLRSLQHASLHGPAWLEDAGPPGAGDEVDGGEQESSIIPIQKTAKRKCTSRKVGAVTDLFAGIA